MIDGTIFSQLPVGSYEGVVFPVVDVTISAGSSAAAYHKFPHKPGQIIELTGREPVHGSMTIALFNNLWAWKGGNTENLWPGTMQLLREKGQEQKLGELVVPMYGTFPRAKIDFTEKYDAQIIDGCYATIAFAEDNRDIISRGDVSSRVRLSGLTNDPFGQMRLSVSLMKLKALRIPDPEGGMTIFEALGKLGGMLDQLAYDLGGPRRLAEQIDAALKRLKASIVGFMETGNYEVANYIEDVRDVVQRVVPETLEAFADITKFVAAADMTLADVASATKNSIEQVMMLNPGIDPLDVAAGTRLIVLKK